MTSLMLMLILMMMTRMMMMMAYLGRSSWLVMTSSASVSSRPWTTASSPRFVYRVTTGKLCWKLACRGRRDFISEIEN